MKNTIIKKLHSLANAEDAKQLQRFFKTGQGEYGEGDKFLGIRVPIIRKVVKEFNNISVAECAEIVKSEYHEIRMFAVLALVAKFAKTKEKTEQNKIYSAYIASRKYINNWDLVDVTTPHIVGAYLFDKNRDILFKFANSADLWERRIAIIATFYFIKQNDFDDTLKIAEILLYDKEDLIHKAVGWMLREVGKRNLKIEEGFLVKHYKNMPRTMLRYAIEKFEESKRLAYLHGKM